MSQLKPRAVTAEELLIDQADFIPIPIVDDQDIVDHALALRDIHYEMMREVDDAKRETLKSLVEAESVKLMEAVLQANDLSDIPPNDQNVICFDEKRYELLQMENI